MSDTPLPQGLHPFRYRITAILETLSPLHVGSGELESGVLPDHEEDGQTVSPVLARTVRTETGAFFLPGSTLKNLLRRAEPDNTLARGLFGEILSNDGGRMGGVFVWGAECTKAEPPGEAPYAAQLKDAFVAARTRIDREYGSAYENALYFQEMIPAGSAFRLEMLVVGDDAESAEARARAVLAILCRLEGGSTLGKGQAEGLGRVRIQANSCHCVAGTISAQGTLCFQPADDLLRAVPAPVAVAGGWRGVLSLRCDGPFLVVDSSHQRNEEAKRPCDQAHLKAQRLKEKAPLVLGSSVMGALRSRAAWLAALEWPDQRSADDPDKICRSRADAKSADAESEETDKRLTPTERLFGVAGFRGLLALEALEVPDAVETWDTLTSVKLDRFSGAPFDGGLFSSAVFVNLSLTLSLVLQDRSQAMTDDPENREVARPTEDDERLLKCLLQDIKDNGLMLGHGTNRGFGWFRPEEGKPWPAIP